MRISIVVPTRDRDVLLARCLGAIALQDIGEAYEIVVVDDGVGESPTTPAVAGMELQVIRSGGRGPATARNLGVQYARGEIVLFTDDDTVPDPGWVRHAVGYLDSHPDDVGVEGPTTSRPFDHLYEHGIQSAGRHDFLTCNIAYRRAALEHLGGFFEGFPYPHCEDLDLGYRALGLGAVGSCPEMVVDHPPRPARTRDLIRRGRHIASDIELMTRHPDRFLRGGRARPVVVAGRGWIVRWPRLAIAEWRALVRSPRRAARFVLVATGQLGVAAFTVCRSATRRGARTPAAR